MNFGEDGFMRFMHVYAVFSGGAWSSRTEATWSQPCRAHFPLQVGCPLTQGHSHKTKPDVHLVGEKHPPNKEIAQIPSPRQCSLLFSFPPV